MLNSVINVDLHIHSSASKYKDGRIVANGDIEHLDVLFEKLEQNDINLFAITDHNRFDAALYQAINTRIKENPNSCVKAALPGVEFDVCFEDGKPSCHVIAIFNFVDEERDASGLENAINSNLLTKPDESYNVEEFENLLKKTKLDFMLIAHQHEGLTINPKKKHSLSNSTGHATEMLLFGYIDAVEYNSSRVQGILLNEFHQLEIPTTAIVGSDCHSWDCYPAHDKDQPAKTPSSTRIKCLPSFQGLLLAFTSPDTRFQVPTPEQKPGFVKAFSHGEGDKTMLSPGLNAVIGENGAGKSSLIELLVNPTPKEKWISDFRDRHAISCIGTPDLERTVQIRQGQLREKFNDDTLFSESLFNEIDHSKFEREVRSFSKALKTMVESSIADKRHKDAMATCSVAIDSELEGTTFNVSVVSDEGFTSVDNRHSERHVALGKITDAIQVELESGYYTAEEIESLKNAMDAISSLAGTVFLRKAEVDAQIELRNIIHLEIEQYVSNCNLHTTEVDSRKKAYRQKKRDFTTAITNVLEDVARPATMLPVLTCAAGQGTSRNVKNGFVFQKTAKYATTSDLVDEFLKTLFNKDFRSLEAIENLNTDDAVSSAVTGGGKKSWKNRWDTATEKFIETMEEADPSILDQRSENKIGNTFGEQSLTFYKYKSFNKSDWDVLIVDQPEDDISHSRINSELIAYLNSLRSSHQVIMVTHNPLLVVNLDVDNVVVLEEKAGKLLVTSGCLESEGVLEKVAEHMDGGKSAIRRRLRAYEAPIEH